MNEPAAHLNRDGRARCGTSHAKLFAISEASVTCGNCLDIMARIPHREPDDDICGTRARYRWHLRNEGKPVRCERCLQAERRRDGDRDAYNARRRERYRALRAAGASSREASQRKDLRRAA